MCPDGPVEEGGVRFGVGPRGHGCDARQPFAFVCFFVFMLEMIIVLPCSYQAVSGTFYVDTQNMYYYYYWILGLQQYQICLGTRGLERSMTNCDSRKTSAHIPSSGNCRISALKGPGRGRPGTTTSLSLPSSSLHPNSCIR